MVDWIILRTFVPMKLPSIFNCSNDMALAANVRQYRPPKRIQQMEEDLAALAQVWENTQFAGPWGWSLATKQRYKQMGVAEALLPSDEWLEELRRLSSREFACRYIQELLEEMKDERLLGKEMKWKENLDLNDTPNPNGSLIFKSPWSSSGRGVFVEKTSNLNSPTSNLQPQPSARRSQTSNLKPQTSNRLQGFLSSQGGYVVDRFYEDKVLDFAMEFFVHEDRKVEFLGWSVFHASENGAYGYNYVESQEELVGRILDGVDRLNGLDRLDGVDGQFLGRLVRYHQEHLAKTEYRGPVGIDMLKTADGRVHPCLEINFRMNMGILALLLYKQYGAGCTKQLTPLNPNGFEALVERGKLMIAYRRQ